MTFDADGNTLTDGTRTNTWDSQNRLVSCTVGGVTSAYTYGADGLRRTSTVNGVTTYYVYDGTMMVREMQQNAQGVLQASATYLCGPRGPEYRRDDTQAEGTYSDSTGTHPAGKTRWYVYDGLGSVVGEVDPSGHLTSSGTFDVYGAKRQGGTGTATSRQGFVGALGHVTDSETGLVYMRARYYDPSVGRFISEDPSYHGANWYIYADNNPTNEVDQNGKNPVVLGALAIAFVIGGIMECVAQGWSWNNFLRGALMATATTAAGMLGGWIAGAVAGALMGWLDSYLTGGDAKGQLLGAVLGGAFGGIGGAFTAPGVAALPGMEHLAEAVGEHEVAIFLLVGLDEGAVQGGVSEISSQ